MIVQRDQIIKKLAEFCEKYPTRGKAAKALKVTPAQLSQTLNKKNNQIPERILKRLGFKSELVYLTIAPKKPNKRAPKKPVAKRAASKDLKVLVVSPIANGIGLPAADVYDDFAKKTYGVSPAELIGYDEAPQPRKKKNEEPQHEVIDITK